MGLCNVLILLLAVGVGIIGFGHRQLVVNPIDFEPVNLDGKVAIVTGATAGIGLETARKLAEWNCTVIVMARNVKKGERVKKSLLQSLPASSTGTIEVMEGALDNTESIRNFVAAFKKKNLPLHILLNNAGMFRGTSFQAASNGIEITYQVNHLGPFLLTELLIPALKETKGESRVVMVSSSLHYAGVLDKSAYSVDNKNANPENMRSFDQSYSDTKYMNVLYANALNEKLKEEGVKGITVNSVHPGFVQSELDQNLGSTLQHFGKLLREYVARSTSEGSVAQVTVATHPSLKGVSGRYFEDHCIKDLCTSCKVASTLSLFKNCTSGGRVTPADGTQAKENFKWIYETSEALTK